MQKIEIETGASWEAERIYVYDALIKDFMGLDYNLHISDSQTEYTRVRLQGNRQWIVMPDILFSKAEEDRFSQSVMPDLPLDNIRLPDDILVNYPGASDRKIPVVFGKWNRDRDWISPSKDAIYCGLDIFGSALFLLSRMEEYINPSRDEFGCFSSSVSLASQQGFLGRPIVNEYIAVMIALLRRTDSSFSINERRYSAFITHDIDHLFPVVGKKFGIVVKNAIGDVIKRHDVVTAINRIMSKVRFIFGNKAADWSNTFDYLMDISDAHSIKSAFYFMSGCSEPGKDPDYSIDDRFVLEVITRIAKRSHEIGLHPSYNTLRHGDRLAYEFKRLKDVAEKCGVKQDIWGGRQHYLRWDVSRTWEDWEDAGLSYDSTLGYYDAVGFRCGACFPFRAFSLASRKRLHIIERPLIAMDNAIMTLWGNHRLEDAFNEIGRYVDICRYFDGEFVLLWHNTNFVDKSLRTFYTRMVRYAARGASGDGYGRA